MNKDKKIFTQNFSGSIEDLMAFTQDNANFVDDVIEGRDDVMLDYKESIQFIKEEFKAQYGHDLNDEEAEVFLTETKLEEVQEAIQSLIEDGLVEIKEYGEDGEPKYGLTEKGEALFPKKKN